MKKISRAIMASCIVAFTASCQQNAIHGSEEFSNAVQSQVIPKAITERLSVGEIRFLEQERNSDDSVVTITATLRGGLEVGDENEVRSILSANPRAVATISVNGVTVVGQEFRYKFESGLRDGAQSFLQGSINRDELNASVVESLLSELRAVREEIHRPFRDNEDRRSWDGAEITYLIAGHTTVLFINQDCRDFDSSDDSAKGRSNILGLVAAVFQRSKEAFLKR